MDDLIRKIKQEVNLNTNNWRKMHGLPMLRRRNKTLWNLQQIKNPTLYVEVNDFELAKKFYENKNT